MEQFIKCNFRFERGIIMNATLEWYLNTIDRYLKPLPILERVDIVKEIKGSILEMENENLSTEQILERLGSPKELAKAYLGDLISNGTLSAEHEDTGNQNILISLYIPLVK